MAYNGKDFMKAFKLANDLKFEDFDVSDKHFILFLDSKKGCWSILPTYNCKFNLCYEDNKISSVGLDLEVRLNQFIEDKLLEQESDGKLSQDYINRQNELWRSFGYGKN